MARQVVPIGFWEYFQDREAIVCYCYEEKQCDIALAVLDSLGCKQATPLMIHFSTGLKSFWVETPLAFSLVQCESDLKSHDIYSLDFISEEDRRRIGFKKHNTGNK